MIYGDTSRGMASVIDFFLVVTAEYPATVVADRIKIVV